MPHEFTLWIQLNKLSLLFLGVPIWTYLVYHQRWTCTPSPSSNLPILATTVLQAPWAWWWSQILWHHLWMHPGRPASVLEWRQCFKKWHVTGASKSWKMTKMVNCFLLIGDDFWQWDKVEVSSCIATGHFRKVCLMWKWWNHGRQWKGNWWKMVVLRSS